MEIATLLNIVKGDVPLFDIFTGILFYSSGLISSNCLTVAVSILFVRVTRGVFADEDVGGLDRMASALCNGVPLPPKFSLCYFHRWCL